MFRKAMSILKASAFLFTVMFAQLQIHGCGGGGGGDGVTPNSTTVTTNVTPNSTPQQVDTSKPAVNSTTPAQNSVAVGTNSAITVTFNEAIDPATVNAQTLVLMKDGTIPVAGSLTTVGTTALFRPTGNLSTGASYTANVTTGVKDLAGNAMSANYTWNFITGTATDTTPPMVIATFPAFNSAGVALNSAMSVTFNEAIDPATINAQTFILLKDGTTQVAGNVSYVGTTAQFRPASNLTAGVSYTATVKKGVKDLAGNVPAADVSWSFTTGSASDSDTVAPQVLSVSPPDGSKNVPVDSPLIVTFNEPVMPFEFGLIDGRPVAVTFNNTYTTVIMKPTVAMHPGSNYYASIRSKDMAGNPMSAAFSWQYSTRP